VKKARVLHPLFFALFPVLFAFAHNAAHVSFGELILPLLVVLACTAAFWAALWVVYRDWLNAAVVLSLFLVLFFSFGHVRDAALQAGVWLRVKYLLPVWTVLLIVGACAVKRRRGPLCNLTRILNVVGGCLVAMSLFNIAAYHVRSRRPIGYVRGREGVGPADGQALTPQQPPDIYYIILDRYARADVLRERYGCDNTEFLDHLREKGFYVASQSCSNYPKTAHSLASSLNMEHLLDLTAELGEDCGDWGPLYERLRDYKAWRFLTRRGYTFVHLGSWWSPTARNKFAHRNINLYLLPEFAGVIYSTTMLQPILAATSLYDERRMQWERVQYKLAELARLPRSRGPIFAFAHMLLPHPPYVFGRDGTYVTRAQEREQTRAASYTNQLSYTNRCLQRLVDTLIDTARVPPVIILQADEGPFPERYRRNEDSFDWTAATPEELREKMAIFSAYYLPGLPPEKLNPSITPVNSFRLVFSHYFQADLQLLPDHCYVFQDHKHLYKFTNVTATLRAHPPTIHGAAPHPPPQPPGEAP